MDKYIIQKAEYGDLPEILELQYLAYQREADLFESSESLGYKSFNEKMIDDELAFLYMEKK